MTTQHFTKSMFHFLNEILSRAVIHFSFIEDVCFPGATSTLHIDHIKLVVQYSCTRGTSIQIHQRILLSGNHWFIPGAEHCGPTCPIITLIIKWNNTVTKTSKGVAARPPPATDLLSPSFSMTASPVPPVMDNRAADVSGSSPWMTVPEEAPDWRSPPLPLLHQPIHHWLKLGAVLECQQLSVNGRGADEMNWSEDEDDCFYVYGLL